MSRVCKSVLILATLVGLIPAFAEDVSALDLTGAWATGADQCSKVFIRKGRANEIEFTALSDRHGGGFIVEANRVRGKFTSCTIKARKDDGQTLNLIVGCSADIIFSNVQFRLKMLDKDNVTREFPGMESMETRFYRCRI